MDNLKIKPKIFCIIKLGSYHLVTFLITYSVTDIDNEAVNELIRLEGSSCACREN